MSKWVSQHWRLLARLSGMFLILTGLFVAYWWLYKLAPARRTSDPDWLSRHSQREYWREVQIGIHRGMWRHDDGFAVGLYGDKAWADWIMNHVVPGASMGCLGGEPCHSATAMRFITNQDMGLDADAWLAWWEKNGSKSQEEWIAYGFNERGFKVAVPPRPEETPILLDLLGSSETDESTAIPQHMKYNAFRCLRDSGFDPVAFALSNRALSAGIEQGLLEYAKRERQWPATAGIGILPFGEDPGDWSSEHLPIMMTPQFQAAAYALMVATLGIGSGMIAWSFRKKRENNGEPEGRAG
jgi:hypothetical protein